MKGRKNERRKGRSALLWLFMSVITCSAFCKSASLYFPGASPGEAKMMIRDSIFMLYNESMETRWKVENRSIRLVNIKNHYDGKEIVFSDMPFFSIGLANGEVYTNEDFKLSHFVRFSYLTQTDSLPTPALRYAGIELSAELYAAEAGLTVVWSAELRNESNYVRQKIHVSTDRKPVPVAFVSFFDRPLKGARYAGSVLGAPIICDNFFFGMENPVAQSKALVNRMIGHLTSKPFDVSHVIQSAGEYTVAVEHGFDPDFDIGSFQLKQNGDLIAEDRHGLKGKSGSYLYRLAVNDYRKEDTYTLHADVKNERSESWWWMADVNIYRKTDDVLNFYVVREDTLFPGKQIAESAVIGVTPERQNRRAFQYYIDRERARPYKQFLHYNTWWDIPDYVSTFTYDADQLLERMQGWYRKFIQPYGVQFHSFVLDDGWDDLDHLWYIDPVKFPDGFAPHAKLCREYDSGIGVWFSPFGGYDPSKARRISAAEKEGMELNTVGFSLAGPNYYKRFYERSADMLTNYKVNYFKYDGLGGSEPQFLPDMEAGTRLMSALRKINPDVYINVTSGTWSSPFWLLFADCTWRGSYDLLQAGEGEDTQKFMTYRDGTLFNNVVSRSPLYPLNSIMTVGIAYAKHGSANLYISDDEKGFKDMVRSYFASGSSLQELYISYDKMKDQFWPVLAEAALWSKANEETLVDTHWVGGSPINLEVYGFASWNGTKGILSLRNPGSQPLEYTVDLQQMLELQPSENGTFRLKSPWKEDAGNPVRLMQSDRPETITLKPFELMVVELTCLEQSKQSLPNVYDEAKDIIGPMLTQEAGSAAGMQKPPDNKEDWEKYRTQLKQTILEKARVAIDHQLALDCRELSHRDMTGYTIKNIMFQTRPGVYATATLYAPKGAGPFPAVVVMMGHWQAGRLDVTHQQMGHTLAMNGYVTIIIDPWGSGERSTVHGEFEYHGANLGASLMNVGETLLGMQITDNMRAVDLLCSLPYVDANRIGATGASGGGNQTMWLSALDDRVKAAVPVVSAGTFEKYVMNSNCICETLPDGLTFSEEAGVLGLIAPRALKICTAFREEIKAFLPAEMFRTYKNLQPIYHFYDADDKLSYFIPDIPHSYQTEFREAMLGWFDLYLQGKGIGAPKREVGELPAFSEKEQMAFETGGRDPLVVNTAGYCRTRGEQLRRDMLVVKKIDVEAKKKELAQLLRLSPDPRIVNINRLPATQNWERLIIETSFGSHIPVLFRAPTGNNKKYVIACSIYGKNGVNPAVYDETRLQGAGVLLLDLWGTGENSSPKAEIDVADRDKPDGGSMFHTLSRSAIWLGKRMMGLWVDELEIAVRLLTDEYGAKDIKVNADKETGLAALFLATRNDDITGLELTGTPASYLFDQREGLDYFSMAIHVPDILQWGDVSLAAALSGKTITFTNPVTMSGRTLTREEMNVFTKEFVSLRKVCGQKGNTIFK